MATRERNHVTVSGEGTSTYLLAHGLGWDQRTWTPLVERLSVDARVVAFDQIGAGRSEHAAYDPVRHDRLDGYVDDLLEIVAELELRRPILVGHSAGALLGMLAEVARPGTFAGLAMLAPCPRYLAAPGYPAQMSADDLAELLDLMEHNFLGWAAAFAGLAAPQAEIARGLHDGFGAFEPRALRRFTELVLSYDARALLPGFTAPTLIVQCAHDALVPVAIGAWMAAAMPRATYRLLDVAGHFPHVSHPAEVEGLLRGFAAGLA